MSKYLLVVAITLAATSFARAADEYDEKRVDEALLALPHDLRAGAAVVYFQDGKQVLLRKGSNGLICRADDPDVAGIAVWCYPQSHDAYARRWYELAATGIDSEEVNSLITGEIKSGELEWPDVAVNYNLRGPSLDTAVPVTVVYVPFATGDTLGISEERKFRAPWLMYAGTAFAHIMIPGQ